MRKIIIGAALMCGCGGAAFTLDDSSDDAGADVPGLDVAVPEPALDAGAETSGSHIETHPSDAAADADAAREAAVPEAGTDHADAGSAPEAAAPEAAPPPCGPNTCDQGCCTADGRCNMATIEDQACGHYGRACVDCTALTATPFCSSVWTCAATPTCVVTLCPPCPGSEAGYAGDGACIKVTVACTSTLADCGCFDDAGVCQ